MAHRPIDVVQKLKINSPVENVYAALTQAEELLRWGPTEVEVDLNEGGGFKKSYHPYSDDVEKGQYLRIVPNQLLKFSLESNNAPNLIREVTIEFKPQDQHTLVIISEIGWRHGRLWEKLSRGSEENWKEVLRDLKLYLESGKDPRGGRKPAVEREVAVPARSNGKLVLKQRYYYNVKPKKVFQALTVPDRLIKWFLKEAEVEFKKNGKVKMTWHCGYSHECKILELDLNKKLSLSWPTNGWSGAPQANTTVTFTLFPKDEEGTLLEVEHTGFGPGENWTKLYGGLFSIWAYYLLNLKSVLEHGTDLRDQLSVGVVWDGVEQDSEKESKVAI